MLSIQSHDSSELYFFYMHTIYLSIITFHSKLNLVHVFEISVVQFTLHIL